MPDLGKSNGSPPPPPPSRTDESMARPATSRSRFLSRALIALVGFLVVGCLIFFAGFVGLIVMSGLAGGGYYEEDVVVSSQYGEVSGSLVVSGGAPGRLDIEVVDWPDGVTAETGYGSIEVEWHPVDEESAGTLRVGEMAGGLELSRPSDEGERWRPAICPCTTPVSIEWQSETSDPVVVNWTIGLWLEDPLPFSGPIPTIKAAISEG